MLGISLGLISFGKIFEEIFIKKSIRYKVMPIGIRTTIPAIKLFLIDENIDLFGFFLDICSNA